jgi:hypothetical protein
MGFWNYRGEQKTLQLGGGFFSDKEITVKFSTSSIYKMGLHCQLTTDYQQLWSF